MSENFTMAELQLAMTHIPAWSEYSELLQECILEVQRDFARGNWESVEDQLQSRTDDGSGLWEGMKRVDNKANNWRAAWEVPTQPGNSHETVTIEQTIGRDRSGAELMLELLDRISAKRTDLENRLRHDIKTQAESESAHGGSQQTLPATTQHNQPSGRLNNTWLIHQENDQVEDQLRALKAENVRLMQANKFLSTDRKKMALKIWELETNIADMKDAADHVEDDFFPDEEGNSHISHDGECEEVQAEWITGNSNGWHC